MTTPASKATSRLQEEVSRLNHQTTDHEKADMASQKAWAIVAGVGPGTGASVARRFAQNYSVALMARKAANYEPIVKEINDAGGKAIGISTDVSDGKSVAAAFEQIKKESGGKVAAAIFNVGGKFVRKPFLELDEEDFVSGFEANGYEIKPCQGAIC